MCAISSILVYGRVQTWNPHCWKMTSTLWMKSYMAHYQAKICDIFLWNVCRGRTLLLILSILQTSAVCYVVWRCGVKGEGWCQSGWGYLAGPDRGWVMGMNRCSDPLYDDSALQHGSDRKATTPQPILRHSLSKSMVVSESLASGTGRQKHNKGHLSPPKWCLHLIGFILLHLTYNYFYVVSGWWGKKWFLMERFKLIWVRYDSNKHYGLQIFALVISKSLNLCWIIRHDVMMLSCRKHQV